MQLTHLGAKNCVTGFCHLLQTHLGSAAGGGNIFVDCGSAYGNDPELPFDRFPVQPGEIDYLFLTHAHTRYTKQTRHTRHTRHTK